MFAKATTSSLPTSTASLNFELAWAMARGLVRMQDTHRQRRHLAELDDRLLDDVGIDRTTALREASKRSWR